MSTCQKCPEPVFVQDKKMGALCRNHFCAILEKRVKTSLHGQDWVKKGDTILLAADGGVMAVATKAILTSILGNLPYELVEKAEQYNVVVVPWSADDEIAARISVLLENKTLLLPQGMRLLKSLTQEEIILYAKAKNLEFTEPTQSPLQEALSKLDQSYPGTKHALLKSLSAWPKD